MEKIVITADSGLDPLNEELMVPGLIIENDEKNYQDLIDITPGEVLDKMNLGSKFKTASPLLYKYEEIFEKHLKEKKDVIHLSMSNNISDGSVNSANLIANNLNKEYENKVYPIDTLTGATGGTLISEYANMLVEKGYNTKEIVKKLEEIKTKNFTNFYVPNPIGFLNSGRDKSASVLEKAKHKALIYTAKALVAIKYHFRVMIDEDGKLYTKSILKGKNKVCMQKLVNKVVNFNNIETYDPNYVVIGTLRQNEIDLDETKTYLENLKYFKNIIIKNISSVVAPYGCDDLCGISLIKK